MRGGSIVCECTKIHRLRGKLARTVTVGEDGVVSTFDTRTKRETNRWVAADVLTCSSGDGDGIMLTVRKGKGKEVMQFAVSAADEAIALVEALQAIAARVDGAADASAAGEAPDGDGGGELAIKVRAATETACLMLGHADAAAPKSGGGRRRSRFLEVKGMLVEQFGADVVEEQQAVWGGVLVSERKERFSLRTERISSGTLDLVAEDGAMGGGGGGGGGGGSSSSGGGGNGASPPPPSPAAQPAAAAAAESAADGSAADGSAAAAPDAAKDGAAAAADDE